MYEYKVVDIKRVLDGDTYDLLIDLGFGLTAHFRFRLNGVDTWELSTTSQRGQRAKEAAEEWLRSKLSTGLVATSHKTAPSTVGIGDGAFGRWAADIRADDGSDLATHLLNAGHVET